MKGVSEGLGSNIGILEPMQSADTVTGQVNELKDILMENGDPPLTIAGFSWGAWLGIIFTAENPDMVKKLILIGCGPLEQKYTSNIMKTRLRRLSKDERIELKTLMSSFDLISDNSEFRRFGELMKKADIIDPIEYEDEILEFQPDINRKVWSEAEILRRGGNLIELLTDIKCPITVIHGREDHHPFNGVKEPLSKAKIYAKFHLLDNCGHYPWLERNGSERFFEVLEDELKF